MALLNWLKALFAGSGRASGTITRTCRMCGKTFTLPEEVQHWPDLCQECRAKHRPVETITRKCRREGFRRDVIRQITRLLTAPKGDYIRTCRRCGREFTFASSEGHWPKECPACRARRG